MDDGCTVELPDDEPAVRVGGSVEQDLALLFEALDSLLDGDGEIDCHVERTDNRIVVRFSASPATLPPEIEQALFEPVTRKGGLKLYLADRSIDAYADLALVEDSDDAVTFEIQFEAVSHDGGQNST